MNGSSVSHTMLRETGEEGRVKRQRGRFFLSQFSIQFNVICKAPNHSRTEVVTRNNFSFPSSEPEAALHWDFDGCFLSPQSTCVNTVTATHRCVRGRCSRNHIRHCSELSLSYLLRDKTLQHLLLPVASLRPADSYYTCGNFKCFSVQLPVLLNLTGSASDLDPLRTEVRSVQDLLCSVK